MSASARAAHPARASHPQWWLAFMLLALHAALAGGIADWWSRAFLLAHFGLFLLWQPVWRGERDISVRHAIFVVCVGVLLMVWNNWWLMAAWLAVLFGLIGGSVPGDTRGRQRLTSMLAAVYLLALLLIWVVPQLFSDQRLTGMVVMLVQFGLPVIPLAILFIRVEPHRGVAPLAVDLFYSLILFLLVVALVLGSFVVKQVSKGDYVFALAQTLFVIALVLIVMSWLWNPRSGFAGLGHLLSDYLMSLGLPFERWVQGLSELAEQEREPQRFLAQAMQHMLDLPWVSGVEWSSRAGQGELGQRTKHSAQFPFHGLECRIYSHWALSPTVVLHLKLLTEMVGHFYEAKRREQVQRQNAYTQAIHETGARLTHDIKNLLQSLRALCSAAENSGPERAPELLALVQRQLPQISQRLNVTLDKLKAPQQVDTSLAAAGTWWDGLVQRYSGRNVQFACEGEVRALMVPAEMFDSVADNLIENALNKAPESAGLRVRATFSAAHGGTLTICDTGAPVATRVTRQLFEAPVPSQTGLGVGLYQSGRQAVQHGYRLVLAVNEPGSVCFLLTREGATSDAL